MFARSDTSPFVMAAPTGARKGKDDHPNLPVSIEEIRDETAACAAAGADAVHLHIRDAAGGHSLDVGLYREAMREIDRVVPGFPIQVTTESAGIFDVDAQYVCLQGLRPPAASISVREIARRPGLAPKVYGLCDAEGISVQHILYDQDDFQHLLAWQREGIVRDGQNDVIFVLGRYAPPRAAQTDDLESWKPLLTEVRGNFMVCAFGAGEHAVLCAAAALGADLRIGFENNSQARDGSPAESTAANVAQLKSALDAPALATGGIPQ